MDTACTGLLSSRKTAARPGCDCRLCRHDPDLSAADRKGVEDVREHRVHVVWASDRADCGCGHEHEQTDEPARLGCGTTAGTRTS